MKKLDSTTKVIIILFILFVISAVIYDGYTDGKEDKEKHAGVKNEHVTD